MKYYIYICTINLKYMKRKESTSNLSIRLRTSLKDVLSVKYKGRLNALVVRYLCRLNKRGLTPKEKQFLLKIKK